MKKQEDICKTCKKPRSKCTCAKNGIGAKFDNEKPRWDLLPMKEVEEIVKVMTFGAKKYKANNWKLVEPKDRYFAALMRHLVAWKEGEELDPDSKYHHLAHVGCNLLFLMWKNKRNNELVKTN